MGFNAIQAIPKHLAYFGAGDFILGIIPEMFSPTSSNDQCCYPNGRRPKPCGHSVFLTWWQMLPCILTMPVEWLTCGHFRVATVPQLRLIFCGGLSATCLLHTFRFVTRCLTLAMWVTLIYTGTLLLACASL